METDSHRPEEASQEAHPHGYTLADAEMERLRAKRESGDVLDPLALDDPKGESVERVVMRVGITVVVILVVGILLAQVACKNIRLSMVPDLSSGVTQERVESALSNGILWGNEIVTFPGNTQVDAVDTTTGTLRVTMSDDTARSLEQMASSAQTRAMALAMNAFEDAAVQNVVVDVQGHVSAEDGKLSGKASDPMQTVLTFTWARNADDPTGFTMSLSGYDLSATTGATDPLAE
ncbi:MAG: hypothetical protein KHY83_09265 [Coriobacteriia bacterium]|nr:hypothetical protein [Coriobacteriia bacterium]MBS5478835.1 hypothetical protein [Coriobacteriia bacterium]